MFIKTIEGEEIEIPKRSWGMERKVGALILDAVNGMNFGNIDFANMSNSDMYKLIPSILSVAPELLSQSCAILLKRDVKWIDDNLDLDSVIGVFSPFLSHIFDMIITQVKN